MNYFLSKASKDNLSIKENDFSIIIKVTENKNLKVQLSFVIWKDEPGRLTFFINDLEVSDDNDDINDSIKYIDYIISNEIIMTEKFCKDKLLKRYYGFYHRINSIEEKVKLYSVNKISFFCKLKEKIAVFKPW
ncbi:MAG: hypothetical protein LC107_06465 [Chitinophagales bacterium]|nr:hypothetical protein [Chitinophagales bacterium]